MACRTPTSFRPMSRSCVSTGSAARTPRTLRHEVVELTREHLHRRPRPNPMPRFYEHLVADLPWIEEHGEAGLPPLRLRHLPAVRGSAELAAALVDWLDEHDGGGLAPAAQQYRVISITARRAFSSLWPGSPVAGRSTSTRRSSGWVMPGKRRRTSSPRGTSAEEPDPGPGRSPDRLIRDSAVMIPGSVRFTPRARLLTSTGGQGAETGKGVHATL